MKNLNLMAMVCIALIYSCKKGDSKPSTDLSTQLVGTWTSTKNVEIYTDKAGVQQTFNNNITYNYIFNSDGTVKKKSGPYTTYSATFNTTSANGNNYVNFSIKANIDGTGATVEVDTYKITTLTDHLLILTTTPSPTWSITNNGITTSGTNAYVQEEYSK